MFQNSSVIHIIRIHLYRLPSAVEGCHPVADPHIGQGMKGMPGSVMAGDSVQQIQGLLIPAGADIIAGRLQFRIIIALTGLLMGAAIRTALLITAEAAKAKGIPLLAIGIALLTKGITLVAIGILALLIATIAP